uniref:Uncharacterized protein n=1 Tax=Graphocephala atropunctata TaxID=36148 RepID=A0A1B6LCU2_9HEMI
MLTRLLRAVLSTVNQLDRGWGVLCTRVVTAIRREGGHHYWRTSITRALQRAVEEGYLRYNSTTRRYFSQGVTRALLNRDNIGVHILISDEEAVFTPGVILVGQASNARRIRHREVRRDVARVVAPPPVVPPVVQRRQRFGQSLCLNVMKLSENIKSLENLTAKETTEILEGDNQTAEQL